LDSNVAHHQHLSEFFRSLLGGVAGTPGSCVLLNASSADAGKRMIAASTLWIARIYGRGGSIRLDQLPSTALAAQRYRRVPTKETTNASSPFE
jgi:hypothetical protein